LKVDAVWWFRLLLLSNISGCGSCKRGLGKLKLFSVANDERSVDAAEFAYGCGGDEFTGYEGPPRILERSILSPLSILSPTKREMNELIVSLMRVSRTTACFSQSINQKKKELKNR